MMQGIGKISRTKVCVIIHIFLLMLIIFSSEPAYSQNSQLRESVVFLKVEFVNPSDEDDVCNAKNQGSGFLITSTGYALTASHVLKRPESCQGYTKSHLSGRIGYSSSGEWLTAQIIKEDKDSDVALIKFVPRNVTYQTTRLCIISTHPSHNAKLKGLGFPRGRNFTRLEVAYQNDDGPGGRWVVSSSFTYGMSGGPVINEQGRVVGLIQSGIRGTIVIRYIIPLRFATDLLSRAGSIYQKCNEKNDLDDNRCIILRAKIDYPIRVKKGSCFVNSDQKYRSFINGVFSDYIRYTPWKHKKENCFQGESCSFGWPEAPLFHVQFDGEKGTALITLSEPKYQLRDMR